MAKQQHYCDVWISKMAVVIMTESHKTCVRDYKYIECVYCIGIYVAISKIFMYNHI